MNAKETENKSHNTEKFWMRFGWIATAFIAYVTIAFIMHTNLDVDAKNLKNIGSLQLNEVGDLFAGIAGSLAMVWLIITVRLQSIALNAQREEMQMQIDELSLNNQHHADQVKEMKLARDLSERQLKQAEKEFKRILEHDKKERQSEELSKICFILWYNIYYILYMGSNDFNSFCSSNKLPLKKSSIYSDEVYISPEKYINRADTLLDQRNFVPALHIITNFFINYHFSCTERTQHQHSNSACSSDLVKLLSLTLNYTLEYDCEHLSLPIRWIVQSLMEKEIQGINSILAINPYDNSPKINIKLLNILIQYRKVIIEIMGVNKEAYSLILINTRDALKTSISNTPSDEPASPVQDPVPAEG